MAPRQSFAGPGGHQRRELGRADGRVEVREVGAAETLGHPGAEPRGTERVPGADGVEHIGRHGYDACGRVPP